MVSKLFIVVSEILEKENGYRLAFGSRKGRTATLNQWPKTSNPR
jgi:hypothetical protein